MCRVCFMVCLYPARGVGELFRLLPFKISGSGLSLSELTAEYLRIEGRIDAVRLDGEVHA